VAWLGEAIGLVGPFVILGVIQPRGVMMFDEELVLIRFPEVRRRAGLCRSSIYQRAKDGSFPAPVSLGGRAVAWIASEIDDWIASRIRESRAGAGNTNKVRV
jgi:prophage regulatory protein